MIQACSKAFNGNADKAPYQRIITQKYVSKGRLVSARQQLFSMYSPDEIELEGVIQNKYLSMVKQAWDHGAKVKACLGSSDYIQCYQLARLVPISWQRNHGGIAYFKPLSELFPIERKTYYLYIQLPKINANAVPASVIYCGKMIYKITNNHLVGYLFIILGYGLINMGAIIA